MNTDYNLFQQQKVNCFSGYCPKPDLSKYFVCFLLLCFFTSYHFFMPFIPIWLSNRSGISYWSKHIFAIALWNHFGICKITRCGFVSRFSIVSYLLLSPCTDTLLPLYCALVPGSISPSILLWCKSALAILDSSPFYINFGITSPGKPSKMLIGMDHLWKN